MDILVTERNDDNISRVFWFVFFKLGTIILYFKTYSCIFQVNYNIS